MTAEVISPHLDLESIRQLRFSYDAKHDIACLHIGEPRPAITLEIGGGSHLRIDGREVVGMELHGLRRAFLGSPTYSSAFAPAIKEIETFAGRTLDENFEAEGAADSLPKTARLLVFMVGQGIATYEADRRHGYMEEVEAFP